MARTIKISHEKLRDPNTITQVQEQIFRDEGLDMHVHEVKSLTDDMKNGVRYLEVKNPLFFVVPELPWKS